MKVPEVQVKVRFQKVSKFKKRVLHKGSTKFRGSQYMFHVKVLEVPRFQVRVPSKSSNKNPPFKATCRKRKGLQNFLYMHITLECRVFCVR